MISRAPSGHRCGESHPRAELPDSAVVTMRSRHETDGLSVAAVAREFNVSYWTARDICQYRTRPSA